MSIALPFTRKELADYLPRYDLIADCIEGASAVKRRKTTYLPMPNPSDTSSANVQRYEHYIKRANFFNATGRTLQGLLGTLFLREPTIKLPANLEVLAETQHGVELGLAQLTRRLAQNTLSFGRGGIFTDFPTVDSPITMAGVNGNVAPLLRVYDPRDILNWRIERRNGRKQLTLVVLHELVDTRDDNYSVVDPVQLQNAYRILRLRDNIFEVEYWVEGGDDTVVATPTDFNGKYFDTIPFTFVGAENNDETCDVPPLEAIAELNIGHYRNSADYEESCFYTGQPTAYFAGLTEDWITTVFRNQPIVLGARHVVPLPADATAGLIQAEPNTMPFEAMQHKERLMVALGARLVEQRETQRTATEANLEGIADTSILGTVANNVSSAMRTALGFACQYAGTNFEEVEFKINTNLGYVTMSADERRELIASWQNSAISFGEMRTNLRQAGIAYEDDEVVKREIEEKQANEVKLAGEMAKATAAAKSPVAKA